MRIIGGKFKGKKIFFLNNKITRPLRDFVRENIFNIIMHKKIDTKNFEKTKILDLYSGFGSFGIECLSRNAKKVVFVEKDKSAFNVLEKNIKNLKLSDGAELNFAEIGNYILKLKSEIKFDLIFLDPPYEDKNYLQILKILKEKKVFKEKHLVIIHREKKNYDKLDEFINIDLTRGYGRSQIIFGYF